MATKIGRLLKHRVYDYIRPNFIFKCDKKMKIPASSMKKITEIITMRPGLTKEEILKEYKRYYLSEYVQTSPDLPTAKDKHLYTISYVFMNYISRPPTKQYKIIPMGIAGIRPTRAGDMADIFALVSRKGMKTKFARVSLNSSATDLLKTTQRGVLYNAQLGKFQGGSDFFADDRTKLTNPKKIKHSYDKLLAMVKARKITISEARKYPSKKGTDGYPIRTDWRIIEGMVVRSTIFKKKDGNEGGVYTISDMTIKPHMFVSKDGKVQSPGFTVWCAPELVLYDTQSTCKFIGSIEINDDNMATMNAYNIIPIIAKEKIKGDKK